MSALRLGLIGLGNQGREHLAAALGCTDFKFVCGFDPQPQAMEKAKQLQSDLVCLSDLAEFSAYQLDGLVLALPHFVYDTLWQPILQLQLPLLKEKPLGRNLDEAMNLLTQAKAAGCAVQTAIQRRHHPSYVFLKDFLLREKCQVTEAHAKLHLGFARGPQTETWRQQKQLSGGGALLDAGYHMVDLLHFLIGSFDIISAALWHNQQLCSQQDVEDQVLLLGRNNQCWVGLDAQIYADSKEENVTLQTNIGCLKADRSGVWHNDIQIFQADKQWQQAMQQQLRMFASNIQANNWHNNLIWDQIPAMRVIEDAYQAASRI